MKLVIQGIECTHRDLSEGEEILFGEYEQSEQYFRRITAPFTDDDLVAIANKEHSYSEIQKQWLDREKKRITYGNGVYAYINGEATYIPASYWGYLNLWTLENGEFPDYREDDRLFFIFKEFLCFETDVLGITRGKGRRQGATSIGTYWEWWICGRTPNSIGGLISYSDTSAAAIFQQMFMRGFKGLLPCFVEEFDSDSENFIRFVRPVEKKKKGVPIKREGLNSYIDYRPTTINSYDSGRLTYGLFDECGKYEKMDINTYWSKVYPTLTQGRKKVGFAYLPTTVNPKKKGGENFKKFWNISDQNAINPATGLPYGIFTPNRVVRYFVPATHGYSGCIDKYGKSIIEDPAVPVEGNDGKMITEGSLSIIKRERDTKAGEQLMEHRRDFPLDEYDMFAFEHGDCEFNEERLRNQIILLDEEKPFLRKVRFEDITEDIPPAFPGERKKVKRYAKWMDDNKGEWLLLEEPLVKNKFEYYNGVVVPKNTENYCIGVDTIRIGMAEHGSKGAICVFKKSHVINGNETGNYPVALYMGRPRIVQHLYDEAIKAALFFGCKINFEISAGDHYYGYMYKKGLVDLLYWTPALDPAKRNPILKPGTESASPFELAAQLEAAKIYFDGNDPLVYNGNTERVKFPVLLEQALEYNHSERTPYDALISLMMALLPALRVQRSYKPVTLKPKQLLPTFKIDSSFN